MSPVWSVARRYRWGWSSRPGFRPHTCRPSSSRANRRCWHSPTVPRMHRRCSGPRARGARRGTPCLRAWPYRREVRRGGLSAGDERDGGGHRRTRPCVGCTTRTSSTCTSRQTPIRWRRRAQMSQKPGVVYAEPDGRGLHDVSPERSAVSVPVEPAEDRHGADMGREPRREERPHRRGHRQRRGVPGQGRVCAGARAQRRTLRQPLRLRLGRCGAVRFQWARDAHRGNDCPGHQQRPGHRRDVVQRLDHAHQGHLHGVGRRVRRPVPVRRIDGGTRHPLRSR